MVWNSINHNGSAGAADTLCARNRHEHASVFESLHQRSTVLDLQGFHRTLQANLVEFISDSIHFGSAALPSS
jgi:DNA-binding LacI/PurR family transcriptional regulator